MTVSFDDIHQVFDPGDPPPNNTVCENCDSAFANSSHVLPWKSSSYNPFDQSWRCQWGRSGGCGDVGAFGYDLDLYIGRVDSSAHCFLSQYYIEVVFHFYIEPEDPDCGCQGISLAGNNWANPNIRWISCYNNPINCYNLNESLDYESHTYNDFDEGCLGLI